MILLAHGSRDARWCAPFERLAASLDGIPGLRVALAYLELAAPAFADAARAAVEAGARHVRVLPLFLAGGAHVERDVPALIAEARAAHAGVRFEQLAHVGEHPELFAVIASIARAAF